MIDIEQLYQDTIRREGVLKEENQRLRELLRRSVAMWEGTITGPEASTLAMKIKEELSDD